MSEVQTVKPKRSGYIDVIKFIFALIILEFHMGTGIFPGGRLAVEGFFMISAYLMMKNIEKNRFPEDSLGVSTARFTVNKYLGLLPYLLPSVLISFALYCVVKERTFETMLTRLPLLIYEIIPLRAIRFEGEYVLGISWYISAMFIALAVLYPLCKKFKTTMTLVICPIVSAMIYGLLSNTYEHLAVHTDYIDGLPINVGILRALAGSGLGIFLYEICKPISIKNIKVGGRVFFTVIEIAVFAYYLYTMHTHPKSIYDYTLVLATLIFLFIGLSGISFSSVIFNPKWAKPLGTASTLIVLNHYALIDFFTKQFGKDVFETDYLWVFLAICVALWIIVWICSKIIQLIIKNAHKIKLFKD